MNDRVVIHLDNEGVAEVRLNRADKMNALDSAMIEGILAAQDQLRAEPRLRAVVLHGEGRAFCAGLDVSRFRSMAAGENASRYSLADRTHGIAEGANTRLHLFGLTTRFLQEHLAPEVAEKR